MGLHPPSPWWTRLQKSKSPFIRSLSHPGCGEEGTQVGARVRDTGWGGGVRPGGEARGRGSRPLVADAPSGARAWFRARTPGPVAHSALPSPPRLPAPARMADKKVVVVFGATGKWNPTQSEAPKRRTSHQPGRPRPQLRETSPRGRREGEIGWTSGPGWGRGDRT